MTTAKILSYAAARTAQRSAAYECAGRHAEAEAYFTASQRMHQAANEQAGLALLSIDPRWAPMLCHTLYHAVGVDPAPPEPHPDLLARCRQCGFRGDEHDFDGKCPASEDDAAYYRDQ